MGLRIPTVRSTRAYHRKGGGRRNGTKQYVLRGLFGTTGLCPVSTAWCFVGLWKDRDACFDRLVRDSRSCFPGRSVSLPRGLKEGFVLSCPPIRGFYGMVLRRSLESLGPSFESFVVPFFPGLGYVANGISAVLFSILRFLSFVPSRRSATVCAS